MGAKSGMVIKDESSELIATNHFFSNNYHGEFNEERIDLI
jgi:hypothetical protein